MTPGRRPVRGARAALGAAAACTLLWACASLDAKKPPKYRLEGSLTEFMAFGYDEVRYESDPTQFALSFVRFRGEDLDGGSPAGEDVPLKVTVRTTNLDAATLTTLDFDLAEDAGSGGLDQRGILSRNVLNDPKKGFTSIQRGGLKLSALPTDPGQRFTGSVHITFDPGIEVSSGRTLFGNFTAVNP